MTELQHLFHLWYLTGWLPLIIELGVKMTMLQRVELSSFDLRYEDFRMKDPKTEKDLIASISLQGIRDPLRGVDIDADTDGDTDANAVGIKENRILLDGFKRYRCARTLHIDIVPYFSLGNDEAMGLITLIRMANARGLTTLEQARLIDELKNVHKMSVAEIAESLEKSKGWVSMRLGIIEKMSPDVMDKILTGAFPAYSYMYTLKPFIRMNEANKKEVDEFVGLVSGKALSIRDIDTLAHGYFNGSDDFRHQIKEGNISLSLNSLKQSLLESTSTDSTELERKMLRDLEIIDRIMHQVAYRSKDKRLRGNSFLAQAHLLAGGILKQIDTFKKTLEEFYDRCRKT